MMRVVLFGGPWDGKEEELRLPLPPAICLYPPHAAGWDIDRDPEDPTQPPTYQLTPLTYQLTTECVRNRRVYLFAGLRRVLESA